MDTVLDFSLKRGSPSLKINGNPSEASNLGQLDLTSALASLMKPQPTFATNLNFQDHAATLMALANFKYLPNYGLPPYAQIPPVGATANFTSNLPTALASVVASALNGSTNTSQLQNTIASIASNAQNDLPAVPPLKRPKLETLLETDLAIPIPSVSSSVASSLSSSQSLPPPPPSPPASSSSSNGRTSSQNSPIRGVTGGVKTTPMRKPPAPIPDEKKDDAYYERRKKNNDAAKRSRDARRQKEEHTASRAQYLEQENIQLHSQIALLKGEIAKLQMLLLTHSTSNTVMAQLQNKNDSNRPEIGGQEPNFDHSVHIE